MIYGAPQGSVLGPKLFSIYVRSQPNIFSKYLFKTSSFADGTNGMKTFSLSVQYNVLNKEVPNCMKEITL